MASRDGGTEGRTSDRIPIDIVRATGGGGGSARPPRIRPLRDGVQTESALALCAPAASTRISLGNRCQTDVREAKATIVAVEVDNGPAADVDGDGIVNIVDLITVLANFGPCGDAACPADTNADDVVDFLDVLVVLDGWTA